jgi:hypothetical protein
MVNKVEVQLEQRFCKNCGSRFMAMIESYQRTCSKFCESCGTRKKHARKDYDQEVKNIEVIVDRLSQRIDSVYETRKPIYKLGGWGSF